MQAAVCSTDIVAFRYRNGYDIDACISPFFSFNGYSIQFGIVCIADYLDKHSGSRLAAGFRMLPLSKPLLFSSENDVQIICKYIYGFKKLFDQTSHKKILTDVEAKARQVPVARWSFAETEFFGKPLFGEDYESKFQFHVTHMFNLLNRICPIKDNAMFKYIQFPLGTHGDASLIFCNLFNEDFQQGFPVDNKELFVTELLRFCKLLHEKNLVHIDLYPSNLFYKLSSSGIQLKIIDWDTVCEIGEPLPETLFPAGHFRCSLVNERVASIYLDLYYVYILVKHYDSYASFNKIYSTDTSNLNSWFTDLHSGHEVESFKTFRSSARDPYLYSSYFDNESW